MRSDRVLYKITKAKNFNHFSSTETFFWFKKTNIRDISGQCRYSLKISIFDTMRCIYYGECHKNKRKRFFNILFREKNANEVHWITSRIKKIYTKTFLVSAFVMERMLARDDITRFKYAHTKKKGLWSSLLFFFILLPQIS